MRLRSRSMIANITAAVLLTLAAAPALAGIHYKATTRMENPQADGNNRGKNRGNTDMQVEGWAAGDKARVEFRESSNPIMKKGAFLISKDAGRTIYLVNPEDKTYAVWDVAAMLGTMGGIMNGMGPLLKFEVSNPKVEKSLDEDGGTLFGLPTRHVRYRTAYTMTIKVFGMGSTSDVVIDEDVWATRKLLDPALGVWLRANPPRTGNEQIDKLIAAESGKIEGIPLKTVSVSTSTDKKKGQKTVTRTTMEVTQLDTSATVASSSFEIPAGYKETEMMPTPQNGRGASR